MEPNKRKRQQPFRKGEAKYKYIYDREQRLSLILLDEANSSSRRAAQAKKSLAPLRRTSDKLSELTEKQPFTGQAYKQAAELLRQKKVQKWHDINTGFEAALMAQLATDLGWPLLKTGGRWLKNKVISPAARTMMNPKNFVFEGPRIKQARINVPFQETTDEQLPIDLVQSLFLRPRLQLPSSQQSSASGVYPPEATYTGRTPTRTIDISTLQQKQNANRVLSDIAQDPNDYTFKEIDDALNILYENQNSVPIILPSSGQTINLGNNMLEELKKVNAVLERYGYEKIPEGMDDVATRLAVLDKAAEHRRFVRSVYFKPRGSSQDKALTKQAAKAFGVDEKDVTGEMKLQTAATHTVAGNAENGRQGLSSALRHYELPLSRYDAIYTSNRDATAAGYTNPGYGAGSKGKSYIVQMPVNDTPNTSLTLLWENNEFPLMNDVDGSLTFWRTHELPYMLKTGKSLQDVQPNSEELKKITDFYGEQFAKAKAHWEAQKQKYSDIPPSSILQETYGITPWGTTYNLPAQGPQKQRFISNSPQTPEYLENIIARNNRFLSQFGKPVTPIVTRKLGRVAGGIELDGTEVYGRDAATSGLIGDLATSFSVPGITEVTLKYPRAYQKLTTSLGAASDFLQAVAEGNFADMGRYAGVMHKAGIITDKQYAAVKNTLKTDSPIPDKYVDVAQAVKKAQRNYFASLGKERSADAFLRKKMLEDHNSSIDKSIDMEEWSLGMAQEHDIEQLRTGIKTKQFEEAGIKPNKSKKSKDGYRVFTTEGIREPDPFDINGTHFAVVGPKDTKMLNVVGEYNPVSHQRHHGHGGERIPGLSRNLGMFLSPLGLSGLGAYNYYTTINQKQYGRR